MLPPKHLYSAAVINKHDKPQEVHAVYQSEGVDDVVEKQVIQPNAHHVFPRKTFAHNDGATHTYHIAKLHAPDVHELNHPIVDGPTKQKAFEFASKDGKLGLHASEDNSVFQ